MTMTDRLYPPSITDVPPTLTSPNASYRRSVWIVLCGLILFMLVYLALCVVSGFALYEAVTYPMGDSTGNGPVLLKVGLVCMSGMLCFFLVKGLFKRQSMDEAMQLEVSDADHPELFDFIRRLCADTRAPFPYRVFLSADVNAAVAYNSSLLNLLLPVKKNLLIGLGLVNCLDVGEFKAVLAHEFGHFSQSSMRLGSYVYMSNRIIADMVYNRDAFDDLLSKWRRQDLRFAIFGHVFYGIVWLLRKLLEGIFRGINFVERALSRQMEFHADLVAVSVSGSDALINALRRITFGNDCLVQALEDLNAASQHHLYTRDLYYHQLKAADHLRRVSGRPDAGIPPSLPADLQKKTQVFEPDEEGAPSMWASHPSSYDREVNAKRVYFRSPVDERSTWLLFRNPDELRRTMTTRFYRTALDLPTTATLTDPEVVQRFIDDEHAEIVQDSRYLGLYDDRWIRPRDVDTLVAEIAAAPWTPEAIDLVFRRLYHREFKAPFLETVHRLQDYRLLGALKRGELKLKNKTFPFRDGEYRFADVPRLYETLKEELSKDQVWLEQLDSDVFVAHYSHAIAADPPAAEQLLNHYRFENTIQDVLQNMNGQRAAVKAALESIGAERTVKAAQMNQLIAVLRTARAAIVANIERARPVMIPPLRNIAPNQSLASFLLESPVVADLPPGAASLNGEWIGQLTQQMDNVSERARRLDSKNLGALLALQERIAADWLAANPQPDEQ